MASRKQKHILLGVVAAGILTILVFLSPLYWSYFFTEFSTDGQTLTTWLSLCAVIVIWLIIAIGRLANHRFFSPADIDASMGGVATQTARRLQSIIQNTLEQTVIAVIAYGAWLVLAPVAWHMIPILCAALFSLGRLCFFVGYKHGAGARAFGFALTFYPSIGLIISVLGFHF